MIEDKREDFIKIDLEKESEEEFSEGLRKFIEIICLKVIKEQEKIREGSI